MSASRNLLILATALTGYPAVHPTPVHAAIIYSNGFELPLATIGDGASNYNSLNTAAKVNSMGFIHPLGGSGNHYTARGYGLGNGTGGGTQYLLSEQGATYATLASSVGTFAEGRIYTLSIDIGGVANSNVFEGGTLRTPLSGFSLQLWAGGVQLVPDAIPAAPSITAVGWNHTLTYVFTDPAGSGDLQIRLLSGNVTGRTGFDNLVLDATPLPPPPPPPPGPVPEPGSALLLCLALGAGFLNWRRPSVGRGRRRA